MKRILAVHAGPRAGWNTDRLIKEAAKGAESAGAKVEYIDLYRIGPFLGCRSCFACKRPESFGVCAYPDALSEVLEKIRQADGLILGSPNYLGNLSAGFRALYERLVFQSLTYNKETPCCNTHPIPVLLIMTSNCPEEGYEANGYTALLENYCKTLSAFVGPTQLLTCGNTLQVPDYSLYQWTLFDPEAKKLHHDETFSRYLEQAFSLGASL
jgi:NAD(P)H-dependent FMN reductase